MTLEHEENQEEITKNNFIDKLIPQIDELLEQEGGIDKFQSQFNAFCLMVENYTTALDKYIDIAHNRFNNFCRNSSEAQKLLKGCDKLLLQEQSDRLSEINLLYIGQCPGPPSEKTKWVSNYSLDYIAKDNPFDPIPVYRPPLLELPVNPVFWFFNEMAHYLNDIDPIKQPNEKELLMCDFVRLAVIHDESCSYNKNIMVYKNKNYEGKFKRDSFTTDLWKAYKNPEKDDFISTHRRILKHALEHVENDLRRNRSLAKESNNLEYINTGAKTIFISHAAENAVLAEIVKTQIDNVFENKVNVFVSSIPGTISPGSDWLDKIIGKLTENNAFIVLVTPHSEKRPFVWFEIGFSWLRRLNQKCEIYAICAPPINPGNLPEPLCRLQAISLADEKQTKAFFDKLSKQFNLGNLDALKFASIRDSLPTPSHNITQSEKKFKKVQNMMFELITQFKTDLSKEDNKLIREFFVLPNNKVCLGGSEKPRLIYYEEEHKELRNKIDILENEGFLIDVTPGNAPIYRMTEEFVELIIKYG